MAPLSTIKVWYLSISKKKKKKKNHTTYSNQSNHKPCLLSLHQLIIPVWIKYQKHVSQISYRWEYRKQCIAIWIVSWLSVSLHPYPGSLSLRLQWNLYEATTKFCGLSRQVVFRAVLEIPTHGSYRNPRMKFNDFSMTIPWHFQVVLVE